MNDASPFRRRAGDIVGGRSVAEKQAAEAAWQTENAEAIAQWNDYVREHGLPLERYRLF